MTKELARLDVMRNHCVLRSHGRISGMAILMNREHTKQMEWHILYTLQLTIL